MHGQKLDEIDIKLMEILQKKGRIKRGQLAEQVGLSIPTISERLGKLEESGIIRGYYAALDPHRIGLELTAFIFLMSESSRHYPEIVEMASAKEEILECHAITGDGSHLLKIRVENTAALEKLLSEIQAWPGVKNTRTDVVLSSPKETLKVSLKHLKGMT